MGISYIQRRAAVRFLADRFVLVQVLAFVLVVTSARLGALLVRSGDPVLSGAVLPLVLYYRPPFDVPQIDAKVAVAPMAAPNTLGVLLRGLW